jgi:hypothetical protein
MSHRTSLTSYSQPCEPEISTDNAGGLVQVLLPAPYVLTDVPSTVYVAPLLFKIGLAGTSIGWIVVLGYLCLLLGMGSFVLGCFGLRPWDL